MYLSDMYHSADWLREQLTNLGVWQTGDVIIVSCEHNQSKREGALFTKAKELLQADGWLHYGDNLGSDVINAYQYGLRPRWVPHSYRNCFVAAVGRVLGQVG